MTERACGSCGTANEADARFCEGCGSALERRCSGCGTQASATARFCRSCGGSLDGPADPAMASPTRKTVTILFADLAGSTTFEEKVDAETSREVMGDYHKLLRATADRYRAGMVKYIGDGFMAVWGVPEISAGDADHAVDAAVELQQGFIGLAARVAQAHGEALALRVAVNTGEVVVGAGDADLVGDALNVAARLESECPHGHVVVGEETWRSTRGRYRYELLSRVQVKGRAAPVAVYQWAGRRSEPADSVPFVGRTHECRRLQTVLDDAVACRGARLVTVIGDPGVGKTRLAAEFAAAQRDAEVLQIRCAAEGTVALAPVVEALRPRDLEADLPSTVPERERLMRDLTGMTGGVAGSVEETFWGLRRYFEVLAARGRLILVLDDIQWADALLLDFVEHLSEWVREAPILMVGLARPELRETRPELVTVGGWVGDAIRLGGLEPGATAELAARVLGSGQLPTELLARLPSSTGGNPLFVRELVAMLVHDGVLVAEAGGWRLTIDVDAIAVPPTIQALLASRLERMNTADRRVLETASVIGTDFSPAAVCALSGANAAEVKASLDRLRRLELAQHSGSYTGDDQVWRFHHILIRDVAYRRLLKSDRAKLHERFADWIQTGSQAGVFESDELVARHLEWAHGYRSQLGSRDSHTAELALRAARCYLSAARRALDRDALVSAGAQAARGAALAAADPALQAELLLVGCEAYLSAGDVAAGAPLVEELDRIADDALAPWATCYRCQYLVYADPSRLPEIEDRLQEAIDEFARRADPGGSAKAYRVRASVRGRLGRIGDCEADLFEALIAARHGGDHRQITAALGAAPNAALWGPSPAPKAGGRCLDVVRMQRMTTAAPSLEATSLRCLAVLELLRGRPDKARSMLADAREIVSELGLRHGLMETELFAGIIESMAGDPVAAEPHFRTALEGLDSLGVGADAGQAAALLARSLLAQGRMAEADRYAGESERIAGYNLKTAIGWRAARAEILSAQARHSDAVAMAREAVDVAADTDLVLDYADACLTLGRVLAASGDSHAAAKARSKAESLYAAKDAVFLLGGEPAPAETPVDQTVTSSAPRTRLTTANRAAELLSAAWLGGELNYSADFVYDDRRMISGEPIVGGTEFLAAAQRKLQQYPHVDTPVLAARGERLALISLHWWDDGGNESTSLDVFELDADGAVAYHGRFDEDDFLAAYAELERRYYAGEGAEVAVSGRVMAGWVDGIGRRDIESVRRLSTPDFRWFAAASSLKAAERTVEDMFEWMRGRREQVASLRHWAPVVRWVSPNCAVGRIEVRGVGRDDEQYLWNSVVVSQLRDGLLASVHEFDSEDEAFAYAESVVAARSSRLVVANRASAAGHRVIALVRAGDFDAASSAYADDLDHDDRRLLSGDPIAGRSATRAAFERIAQQYNRFELRTVAVRGDRLHLAHHRWSDDNGNQTSGFTLHGIGDNGLIVYDGRFDEDDFESAYLELERRYYAGEGAPFAEAGATLTDVVTAANRGDIDTVFDRIFAPGCRVQSRSRTIIPKRTLAEFRSSVDEFNKMVSSSRIWYAAVHWLSPAYSVVRQEREAVGADGQKFQWSRIYVGEGHDGRITAFCEFDVEFEEQAFAYAEECVRRADSRLAVVNPASGVAEILADAVRAGDHDLALAQFSSDCEYQDRRRLRGDPIVGHTARRAALKRISQQYTRSEMTPLAVRGDHLALVRSRRSDDAGNESTVLVLDQTGDDDRLVSYVTFDEDDFESAYAELERRHYAGEGAAFAGAGAKLTDFVAALNRGGMDAAFALLDNPDLRIQTRSRSVFPERTPAQVREDLDGLVSMVFTVRWWYSAVCWLSPTCCVVRQEREATGPDGERYAWTDIYAVEFRGDVPTWICRFNIDDEARAFAHAHERMALHRSRLSVSNRASEVRLSVLAAIQRGDIDAAAGAYSEELVYDDRRRLSGEPVDSRGGMRGALARLRTHYSHFGGEILAVRGDRLGLGSYECSDDDGNQTAGLLLIEVNEDEQVCYEGRFDEDDFETAYHELDHRYCAGQGVPLADYCMTMADYFAARNRGDLDTLFTSLSSPALRIEELAGPVESVRDWISAIQPITPTWGVSRYQRQAVGRDGEDYQWERIVVAEICTGRVNFVCDFDVDDEEAAFAYAEERARASATRLAVANRASEVLEGMNRALSRGDADGVVDAYREDCCHDDRRRLAGGLSRGRAELEAAVDRILQQFNDFQWRTLAVRGRGLAMGWTRWADDSGNMSTYLLLAELDDNDRISYEAWFEEGDFASAYHELDRRFYAGEGATFAVNESLQVDFMDAVNRLDLAVAQELCLPTFRLVSPPTTLATEERSLKEFFSWMAERAALVPTVRHWMSVDRWVSVNCLVSRLEIQSIGPEGDEYTWPRIAVSEMRGGLLAGIRQFDVDDEDAAFAYAAGVVAKHASRLPSTNIASEVGEATTRALQVGDFDAVTDYYGEGYVFDDRRHLSGDPLCGRAELRLAAERICKQYNNFDERVLAVRGKYTSLAWSRWSDAAGNQTEQLHVVETGADGRISYAGRFDEDDFEGAYVELERRYYAGEGAPSEKNGLAAATYVTVMNRGDFDAVVNEFTSVDFRIENRSRSAFPDRSAAELRTSLEQLHSMVESVRSWFSSIAWVSPSTAVSRMEREAVGRDGEPYSWSRILVSTWRDGRLASLGDFDTDDEDAAFAYAESIVECALTQTSTRISSARLGTRRRET